MTKVSMIDLWTTRAMSMQKALCCSKLGGVMMPTFIASTWKSRVMIVAISISAPQNHTPISYELTFSQIAISTRLPGPI